MVWSILLADDEAEYVRIQKRCLERAGGYIVYAANNGREALEIIEKETVDIMVLDLTMPVMDGIELLIELHNRHIWIPVLILTGRRIKSRERPHREFGIVEFMDKPVRFDDLKGKMDDMLKAGAKRDVTYDLSLTAILEVLEMERKTGVLTIHLEKEDGRIYFRDGVVVEIDVKGFSAKEAISECLKLENRARRIAIEYGEHRKKNRIDKWLTEMLPESS